ncbi:MAG: UDP-N-acetylmuramoyl-L-alanyl-D-glutamate--2,6-diaminopimelate ligase [Firmicutes bacterium]|nr:UDP-N-acetylmuramoyl-L-alanyl-D-glutamate--2,6-diaminopimelate ligase [Bacillota bacterium]MBR2594349.1 UDP-N-acetylmuramoyl-L-alanyl-D-glutamate--2,6-diaminopimelate ligase [Bacillota bacterium]
MKLSKLLEGMEYKAAQGSLDTDVKNVVYNSREASEGSAFVCITGFKTDGHKYVNDAIGRGANVIIAERPIDVPENITLIISENNRRNLAIIANNFYNDPSSRINLIGVTGTNGKTTTTFLVKAMLERKGRKTGLIGTIENRIGDEIIHTERTTPESLELAALFDEMYQKGARDVIMEVSSHALDLDRVYGFKFDTAVFTNLTQDHLDYHKTMENYRNAKAILFRMADKAVINTDDEAGLYMAEVAKGEIITFGIDNDADLRGENIVITADGVSFDLEYGGKVYPVRLNIPGKFSIYNALGAIGTGLFSGLDIQDIIDSLAETEGIRGRFQTIKGPGGFNAIVDYAHTPDGLENILNTAKEFAKGRIITVFGCGGDRDRTKRPIMGDIAGKLSDFCIITSDNPRTENPESIIDDIEEGTKKTGCEYIRITDRKEAIFKAVSMAEADDVVIVAGKGHEDYQIFADKTIHFDDSEVIKEAFSKL